MRALPVMSILIASLASSVEAQAPRYAALHLEGARYLVEADATIEMIAGKQRNKERIGRRGIMVVEGRVAPGDTLFTLEAWFDSLALFREGESERIEPETDGLIGGRYFAVMTPRGVAASTEVPFFPDDVAQVSDLSRALVDLLPPLPPVALNPGAGWKDDFGLIITRLADMTIRGQRVQRYRLARRSTRPVEQVLPDSSVVNAERAEAEEGTIYWSTNVGLVRWERSLTDELKVEAGGIVKQPFRTRIEQKVVVERLAGG